MCISIYFPIDSNETNLFAINNARVHQTFTMTLTKGLTVLVDI